jgi:ABC-type nitrate/sulfonate/bicarbonate transport system substrate-binding protein
LAVGFVLACTGIASGAPTNADRAGSTVVKITCNREFSEVFLWDLGRFAAKYGITPKCIQVNTFDESLQALSNGSVSIGILGIPEVPTIAAKNLPLKVVAGYTNAGQDIVVRNGAGISQWSDFAGKTICVPQGTGVATMVQIALLVKGLVNKVKVQGIGFVTTAAIQGLQNGTCDALAYWSPVMEQAVDSGAGHFSSAIELNRATPLGAADGVMAANSQFLGNKTLAVNFLKAYVASMKYYNAHPNEWATKAAELTGASKKLSIESYKHQIATYKADLKAMQAAAKFGPKLGYEPKDVSSKIRSVIDVSLLATATGQSQASLLQSVPFKGSH